MCAEQSLALRYKRQMFLSTSYTTAFMNSKVFMLEAAQDGDTA
jgi:hypothetical protein